MQAAEAPAAPALTAPRVTRLDATFVIDLALEIKHAGMAARAVGKGEPGGFSYPAMCGSLQAILRRMVEQVAGADAGRVIDDAMELAFPRAEEVDL
jgi:hypothetical protein